MSRLTTCGLTVLLAFAPAALAVDGVVLINQSTITTGLPGCPTGGHFPIIICQSGSYRLSGNLTLPDANTDGIDITVDNVTIDLNGFSILGPVVCSGSPVTSCSPVGFGNGISSPNSNLVVINGQIRGVGLFGIALGSSDKTRLQNINATSNGGDAITTGSNSLVSSCTAISNGGDGITAFGVQSMITGNIANFNGENGIRANQNAVISGNSVVSNGFRGLNLTCPSLVSGNLASFNTGNISTLGSGCVLVNNAP
jgi:hypothetical protein